MKRLRLLIVEDHETVRDGLRLLFETQSDVEVLRGVADGAEGITAAFALAPDVVVLDLSMPGMSGLAVATAIRERSPAVAIVVLTRHSERAYVQELLGAGVLGYVLKQSPFNELMDAVRAAAAGEQHIDAALAAPPAARAPRAAGASSSPSSVTGRETEVLRLSATGKSNKEVAAALSIAVKTVEVHKSNAMRKLHLHDRAEMLRFAALKGWLDEL
jgi:DNA-binding NarL/FixJ family response regulator